MRKFGILAVALTSMVAVAVAAAMGPQVNTYTVAGAITPSKAGTSAKPVPVKVNFNYTVGEQSNHRPLPVKKYSIAIAGVRTNGGKFPACTAAKINAAKGSVAGCPSGSAVGAGSISAQVGSPSDLDGKVPCKLNLTVYNGGQNKAAIFVKGGPPACPTAQAKAIDARYIQSSKGTSLNFTVPPELLHQLGLDIAVVNVQSTIKKLVKRVKGKSYGYYESVGGCKKKRRDITVAFTTENGVTTKAQKTLVCS